VARSRRAWLRVFPDLGRPEGGRFGTASAGGARFSRAEVERQVRVVGLVTRVPEDEAVRYWATRPRGHRLSAWASPQSEVVDEAMLDERVASIEARFAGVEPPLPPFWGGYVVGVEELELWQ